LTRLLEKAGPLSLTFTSTDVLYGDVSTYPARSREDNLAQPFFRDGVRAITIQPGIEPAEVENFLDQVLRVSGSQSADEDLVTLLWDADLPHLDVDYVPTDADIEAGGEGGEGAVTGPPAPWPKGTGREVEECAGGPSAEASIGGGARGRSDDWQTSAESTDVEPAYARLELAAPQELNRFGREFAQEQAESVVRSALTAIGDCLAAHATNKDRSELGKFLPRVLREAIRVAHWGDAREALSLIRSCDVPGWSASSLVEELLGPYSVVTPQCVAALDHQPSEGIGAFLAFARELGPEGREWLMTVLAQSQQKLVRRPLTRVIADLCKDHPEQLKPWLSNPQWYVVRNVVHIFGWIGGSKVVGPMREAVDHPEPRVRQEVVAVLSQVDRAVARPILLGMLDQAEGDLFEAVLHQVSLERDPLVAKKVIEYLLDPRFAERPTREKQAIFSALAACGGDECLPAPNRNCAKDDCSPDHATPTDKQWPAAWPRSAARRRSASCAAAPGHGAPASARPARKRWRGPRSMIDPRLDSLAGTPPDDRMVETVLGAQLVTRLHGLLRSARIYEVSNQAVQGQIQQVMESLAAVMDDEVTLLAMGQHFYVNGVRIKARPIHLAQFEALSGEFEVRGLGGLRFLAGLTRPEIESFLRMFVAAADASQGQRLPEAAAEADIIHIIPVRANEIAVQDKGPGTGDDNAAGDEKTRARRSFWRAVAGARHVLENTARTGKPAIRQARRAIQPLVDTLMKDEYSILGLTALKDHDEYTYAHCVNVSLLSIAIGHRFGLPRSTLANLGVAALLHDLGKLAVPAGVLQKAGKLTAEEWALIQRHPLEGAKLVSRLPGLTGQAVDTIRVCLQHHQSCDRKGYPEITREWRLPTLVRIVSAADCYDAMTGHRAYRHRPMTGFEALQQLLGSEAPRFDPAVLWALVRSVGLYPPGTVMVTRSGYTALSLSPNPSDPRRPFSRVLRKPGGRLPAADEAAAWSPMPANEAVAKVIPSDEVEIDVEASLLV